jgi:hypothetical protein
MLRTLAIASLLALGIGGPAWAQDSGPRLIGGGDDAQLVYPEPSRNVVGGGVATITGGADNLQITYGPRVTVGESLGLIAEMVGGGDDRRIVYRSIGPSDSRMAGRGARPGG